MKPQGKALGRLVISQLEAAGVYVTGYRWVYRPHIVRPTGPFPPHRDLAGEYVETIPTADGWEPGDHKGCVTGDTIVDASQVSAFTLRWYEGVIVRFATASGEELSITPHHPVLTDKGWVPAGRLVEGDHVIRCLDAHRATGLVPDIHYRPARVDDLFASLWAACQVKPGSVPVTAEDFHGDGGSGEVHVIRVDRDLMPYRHTPLPQPSGEETFTVRSGFGSPFTGSRSTDTALDRVRSATFRSPRPLQPAATFTVGQAALPDVHLLGSSPYFDTGIHQPTVDRAATHADTLGESQHGIAGHVTFNKVIDIRAEYFAGHVFNLSTRDNWYVAATTIVHNCSCDSQPVLRSPQGRFLPQAALRQQLNWIPT